ncbi:MAG: hypothetical protein AAB353_07765 [Candidatus Hydrogenedentota bacterium]
MGTKNGQKYVTADELFKNPVVSESFAEARKDYLGQLKKNLLDEVQLRQQEDWSVVSHLSVGGENVHFK